VRRNEHGGVERLVRQVVDRYRSCTVVSWIDQRVDTRNVGFALGQRIDDAQCRRGTRFLDAGTVRDTEDDDRRVCEVGVDFCEFSLESVDDDRGHLVVNPASRLSDGHRLVGPAEQEMWIVRNAVAADAGAGIVKLAHRQVVSRVDRFADRNLEFVCEPTQFVGQPDVHVPIDPFEDLDGLRRRRVRDGVDLVVREFAVDERGCPRTLRVDTADDLGVLAADVAQGGARGRPFGAKGEPERVGCKATFAREMGLEDVTTGSRRQGRLGDHQIARCEPGCDVVDDRFDRREIGIIVLV